MKKRRSARFTCGLSFLFAVAVLAHSPYLHAQAAVEELNGEASLEYSYWRLSDGGATAVRQAAVVAAQWNVPVWKFVGGSIAAMGGREHLDVHFGMQAQEFLLVPVSFSCNTNSWSGAGSLFLRDPTVGRVRATYSYGEQPTGCFYSSSFGEQTRRAKSSSYGLDAEYYFETWTVAAGASRNTQKDTALLVFPPEFFGGQLIPTEEIELRTTLDRYSFGLLYYPTKDWRLGATVSRLQGESNFFHETTYGVSAEYQPPIFGSRASLSLIYGRAFDADTVGLRLTWFFGPQADLQRRDRYFR